ncbi:MAG: hypothetical protein LH477_16400 [Nocardioides sp.]|nr:hypothetical protein [Nocardioides sp.]
MTAPTATTGSERSGSGANTERRAEEPHPGVFAKVWRSVSAAFGALLGLLPHLLHHTGLIFGAALVTGTGGNLLFGALGLLFSVPLLRRLYVRFKTWKAPAVALVIFVAMFSLSAFVIGPAISGGSSGETPPPGQTPDHSGHAGH